MKTGWVFLLDALLDGVMVTLALRLGGAKAPVWRIVLAALLGAAAARLIAEEKYGYMCAVIHDEIVPVPLEEVAGKLKKVPADCPAIQAAKEIGMSFGN